MIDILWRFLRGWVIVRVSGRDLHRILSQMALAGHRLWSVRKSDERVEFVMDLGGLLALRRVVRQHGGTLRFGERGGAPLWWSRCRRRPFLAVGLATALWLAYGASHRIWVVDAPDSGLGLAAREEIVRVAAASGLAPGTPIGRIRLKQVHARLVQALPRYSWIGINRAGVYALIRVLPAIPRPPSDLAPRLIAAASGKIVDIEVYSGEAVVAVGDRVRKGQVLIAGTPTGVTLPGTGASEGPGYHAPAVGQVWADVTRSVKVYQPFRMTVGQPTGRSWVNTWFVLPDGRSLPIGGFGVEPYLYYRRSEKIEPVFFEGMLLPLKRKQVVYNEEKKVVQTFDRKSATARAEKTAQAKLAKLVPQSSRKLSTGVRVQSDKAGVWVTMTWKVRENIAVPPPGKKTDTKG